MSITIVHTLQEEEWRMFVDNHPEGNVYHTPEMFQVFSRTRGFQPESWAATKESHILALLLPARITLTDRGCGCKATKDIGACDRPCFLLVHTRRKIDDVRWDFLLL
jgi:hypothetical protein